MPILRGAVTFASYRVEGFEEPRAKDWIVKSLRTRAFQPINSASEDERSVGFVELEDRDAIGFSAGAVHQGEFALFSCRVDTLKVPGGQLREELEKWCKTFEAEHTRPCSRYEKKEARATLKQVLRKKLSPKTRVFDVSWNLKKQDLQIWAASRTAVEEVAILLEKTFEVRLSPWGPAATAQRLGLAEASLLPTPDLSWPDFDAAAAAGKRGDEVPHE